MTDTVTDVTATLPKGQKFKSQGRTITEGDLSLLTNLTWTTSELHSNAEYMKGTQFGNVILAGPCVLACVIGLAGTSGFRQALHASGNRLVAMLGFEEVKFKAPVLPGDTLRAETEIVDARASSSNPRRGILKIRDTCYKQTGEMVSESIRNAMFERVGS
ncbi:MAG: MaoC family dehydratase [Chloroflexi bacterium]|nr:MaoC family dehydratase [Chloroflexota bacterium]